MEFRLLGSLEVVNDDGGMVPLGPPRQHALLAALVLHAGSWLSVERLVDLLWGERPPATAATIVHGSVAGLRRVLEPARERGNPARLWSLGPPATLSNFTPSRWMPSASSGSSPKAAGTSTAIPNGPPTSSPRPWPCGEGPRCPV